MTDFSPGTVFDAKYQIVALVGSGAMGQVYEAVQLGLQRRVALKLIYQSLIGDARALERFEQEGKLLARLNHPNIPLFYGLSVWQNRPYIVMEFVEGQTLRQVLEEGSLALIAVLKVLILACDALSEVHLAGFAHRDLKPNNIILVATRGEEGDEYTAKVVDFGIAAALDDNKVANLTRSGELAGSLYYMSPEQCKGQRSTSATDIYSMGCILYECLTGRPPFCRGSVLRIMHQHVNASPAAIKNTERTSELSAIIVQCLEKAPQNRPTARQLQMALEEIVKQWDSRDERATLQQHHRKRDSFHRLTLAASCLLIPIAVLPAFFQKKVDPESPRQLMEQAREYFQQRNFPEVFSRLDRVIRTASLRYRYIAYIERARLLLLCNKTSAAEADLAQAFKIEQTAKMPSEAKLNAISVKACSTFIRGDIKDALREFMRIRVLRQSVPVQVANAEPVIMLAYGADQVDSNIRQCFERLPGGKREAIAYYRHLTKKDPSDWLAGLSLTDLCIEIGDFDEARKLIDNATKSRVDDPYVAMWLKLLHSEGKIQEEAAAVNAIEKSLEGPYRACKRFIAQYGELHRIGESSGYERLKATVASRYKTLANELCAEKDMEAAERLARYAVSLSSDPSTDPTIDCLKNSGYYYQTKKIFPPDSTTREKVVVLYRTFVYRTPNNKEIEAWLPMFHYCSDDQVIQNFQSSREARACFGRFVPPVPQVKQTKTALSKVDQCILKRITDISATF